MTKREKLLEQYEDALFSLLMDEFAEIEGQAALKENERLKADPSFTVPKELHQRCIRTITLYFAKENIKNTGHVFFGLLKKAAMVALIAVLLFTTALAASTDLRMKALNLMTEIFDDRTELSFVAQDPMNSAEDDGQEVMAEWIPEGFYQCNKSENEFSIRMDYCSDNGEEFSISLFNGTNMGLGIDTEDAEVESIDIQGEEALMVSKGGMIQIVWANQELPAFYIIEGPETMKEDLIKVAQSLKIGE